MIANLLIEEFKSYGNVSYRVFVQPGQYVEIHTRRGEDVTNVTKFRVGDPAEYDSFNLKYIGVIKSITAKTVTVQPRGDRSAKRMKLEQFSWRNADFNLDRITRENAETMNYI